MDGVRIANSVRRKCRESYRIDTLMTLFSDGFNLDPWALRFKITWLGMTIYQIQVLPRSKRFSETIQGYKEILSWDVCIV